MLKLTATHKPGWLDDLAKAVTVDAKTRLRLAFEQVGRETVDYLRSLAEPPEFRPGLARSRRTGALYQPSVTKRRRRLGIRDSAGNLAENAPLEGPLELASHTIAIEGPRRAHPGHWGDRSGQLALSYSFEVIEDATSVSLVFRNSAEYAFWVEVHDGFFVLSGVVDPGGPVDTAFRAIAGRLFPDWRITTTGVRRTAEVA